MLPTLVSRRRTAPAPAAAPIVQVPEEKPVAVTVAPIERKPVIQVVQEFPTSDAMPNGYPKEWDEPNPPGAVPQIKQLTFKEWTRQNEWFSKLGVNSLTQAP